MKAPRAHWSLRRKPLHQPHRRPKSRPSATNQQKPGRNAAATATAGSARPVVNGATAANAKTAPRQRQRRLHWLPRKHVRKRDRWLVPIPAPLAAAMHTQTRRQTPPRAPTPAAQPQAPTAQAWRRRAAPPPRPQPVHPLRLPAPCQWSARLRCQWTRCKPSPAKLVCNGSIPMLPRSLRYRQRSPQNLQPSMCPANAHLWWRWTRDRSFWWRPSAHLPTWRFPLNHRPGAKRAHQQKRALGPFFVVPCVPLKQINRAHFGHAVEQPLADQVGVAGHPIASLVLRVVDRALSPLQRSAGRVVR